MRSICGFLVLHRRHKLQVAKLARAHLRPAILSSLPSNHALYDLSHRGRPPCKTPNNSNRTHCLLVLVDQAKPRVALCQAPCHQVCAYPMRLNTAPPWLSLLPSLQTRAFRPNNPPTLLQHLLLQSPSSLSLRPSPYPLKKSASSARCVTKIWQTLTSPHSVFGHERAMSITTNYLGENLKRKQWASLLRNFGGQEPAGGGLQSPT